ncbi:MAG: hypothetical protein K6A69_10090 [Lachnospiraceae bacterium]|nr:hypothetical protein [Lachnospiraceae bacterium]
MEYGSEALDRMQVIEERMKLDTTIYQEDSIELNSNRGELLATVPRWDSQYIAQANDRKAALVAKLSAKDTFAERLRMSEAELMKSSWLLDRTIPKKATIDKEMEEAHKVFGFGTLSDSQKAKRGQKFKEKAERQAKAARELKLHQVGRTAALDAVLTDTIPAGIYALRHDEEKMTSFLSDTGHLEGTGEMMDDIAFYAVWKNYAKKNERKMGDATAFLEHMPAVTKEQALARVRNLTDSDNYKEEYVNILLELEQLDIDLFNYQDDDQFIQNYSCKLAALRMYSHGDKMLKAVEKDPRLKGKAVKLLAKTAVINDIIKDYENRALMIQSPYYVLLAGKEVEGLSEKDLRKRLERTEDDAARGFIQRLLERRTGITFKKGAKASDFLPKAEKKQLNDMKAYHKEDRDTDAALMETRDAVLDKYRKDIKKKNKKLTDDEVNAIAIQRYAEERANPYRQLVGYQADMVLNEADDVIGYIDEDSALLMHREYYTIDEHPAFKYEKHFVKEKPFLNLGDGVRPEDIAAVYNLNRRLASEYHERTLAQSLLPQDVFDEYYRILAELAVYKKKYEYITGLDKGWAEERPDTNEAFSESDKKKRKAMTSAVDKCVAIIKDDWYYQSLCQQALENAARVRNMLYDRMKENSTEETAKQSLKDSTMLGRIKSRANFDKLEKTMYGGTPMEKEHSMPDELPLDMAIEENEIFLGRKLTDQELRDLKETYESNYPDVEKYRKIRENLYAKRDRERKAYGDIEKVGSLRDEWSWAEVLPKEERRAFLEAAVKVSQKSRAYQIDAHSLEVMKAGLKKVFDFCLTMANDEYDYVTNDDLFDNYEKKQDCINLGFTMMNALEVYRKVGGVLEPDVADNLVVICDVFANMENTYRNRGFLAVSPEAMVLQKEGLSALTPEQLDELRKKFEHEGGDFNSRIKDLEEKVRSEEEKILRNEESKLTADQIKQKKVEIEDLKKKKAVADRRQQFATILATEKRKDLKRGKLKTGDLAEHLPGVSLEAVIKHDTEYEVQKIYGVTGVYSTAFAKSVLAKKKLDDKWKTSEKRPASSLLKLAHLADKKILICDIKSAVELSGEVDYSQIGKAAVKGLLLQFNKETGKAGFRQFGFIAKPFLRSAQGDFSRNIAATEDIMTMASDLEEFLVRNNYKDKIISELNEEEKKLYEDIQKYTKATLPMFAHVMADNVGEKEKKKRLDAMNMYFQDIMVNESKMSSVSVNDWICPFNEKGYMDYYNERK